MPRCELLCNPATLQPVSFGGVGQGEAEFSQGACPWPPHRTAPVTSLYPLSLYLRTVAYLECAKGAARRCGKRKSQVWSRGKASVALGPPVAEAFLLMSA